MRIVVKLWVAGRLVAAKVSVIMTSLFGSAPWSPFPCQTFCVRQHCREAI
jgi:hypothetical protein